MGIGFWSNQQLEAWTESAGEFLPYVFPGGGQFSPLLNQCVGRPGELCLAAAFPGTANTSRFCSSAQREVMRVPLYSPASTTKTPRDRPLMIRLRIGKSRGRQTCRRGNSLTSAPPKREQLVGQLLIFARINNVDAGAENRYRAPFGRQAGRGRDARPYRCRAPSR